MERANKDFMTCKCVSCTERRELMVKFAKIPDHMGCTVDELYGNYGIKKERIKKGRENEI